MGYRSTSEYPGNVKLGLLLRAELLRVLARLEVRGIPAVVLKGAPLAARLGLSFAARPHCDNDVLVRKRDVARTVSVLRDLGYRAPEAPRLETLLDTDFQVCLTRELSGVSLVVDLHWTPFFPPHHAVAETVVWSHLEPMRLDRATLQVLDRPMTLLHLAVHYEQHAFCEPRILSDLAQAWNRWSPDLDTGAFRGLAQATGLAHAFEFAISPADALGMLARPAPRWGSRRVTRVQRLVPPAVLARPARLGNPRRTLAALLLLDPSRVLRVVAREAFPHPEKLAASAGEPLSARTLVKYLTRPARFVVEAVKGEN